MWKNFTFTKLKFLYLLRINILLKAGKRLCYLDGLYHANSKTYGSYKASCLGESST